MSTHEESDQQAPLAPSVLLGVGAGLIGAGLGWLLMSSQAPDVEGDDARVVPTITSEEPIATADLVFATPTDAEELLPPLSYFLQVAAYRSADGAEESASHLEKAGFPVHIKRGKTLHRLLIGPLESPAAVAQTSDRLVAALDASPPMRQTIPGPWLTIPPEQDRER